MQATAETETEQAQQNLGLVFDVDALKHLVKAFLATTTDYEVGLLFGYTDNSSWSLYKNGKRRLNTHIIARAIELFPGVPTSAYTRNVVVKDRMRRS